MSNLVVISSILLFSYFQILIHLSISHQTLRYLLLFFTHSLQIIIVYSYLQTEKERAINIHARTIKQSGLYRTMHDLQYSPETIATIAIAFVVNKVLLYRRLSSSQALIETLLLITPLYITFPVTRTSHFEFSTPEQNIKYWGIYYLFAVVSLLLVERWNVRLVFILLIPVLNIKFSISHLLLLGMYADSMICCVFDLPGWWSYLGSVNLLLVLKMMDQKYLVYNSHKIPLNVVYLFALEVGLNFFHLESSQSFQEFEIYLLQCISLGCWRLLIIYSILSIAKTMIVVGKDKTYLQYNFLGCFKGYFDIGIFSDTLVYKHLNRLSSRVGRVAIILGTLFFPLNHYIQFLALTLAFLQKVSVLFLMRLRLVLILFVNITLILPFHSQGNTFLRHISHYFHLFGRVISTHMNNNLEMDSRINEVPHYTRSPYQPELQQYLDTHSPDWSVQQLLAMMSITVIVQLLGDGRWKEQWRGLKCMLIIGAPIVLLTAEWGNSFPINLYFYILVLVKYFQIYSN